MSDISAIKLPDNSSYNIKAKKLFYAECSTAVNVVAKVISCDGFVLEPGAIIAIRFTSTTTTAPTSGNITLNINGTGAKNIVPKENNAVYSYAWAWYFSNNRTWLFVYNGTYFICLNQDNNNVNPEAFGIGYATCSTAETTSAKVAVFSGYVLRKNGIIAVKFTYAVPANSTLNINSKGAKNIFYRGAKIAAGVINAGDIATFVYDGTQYQLISVDADYARKSDVPAIDSALSSTSTNPVQNKVINSALAGKAAASHSHTISQISDFPTSIPFEGGNADTVDGLHADNFLLKSDSMAFNGIAINADRHSIGDVNNYWSLWTDNEGGNFELRSPDKSRAIQMDCFDNNIFRIYSWLGTNFWGLLEANHVTGEVKINGRPNHRIPTLTSDGGVYDINHEHTNDAFIQWDGSSYFKLKTYSGHLTAVDYATNSNNSNILGGIVDAYHLGTFSTAGDGHGADWQLYCQHNIYGDGRFGFRVGDGSSQIRCDYATEAGKPYVTGTFTHNGSAVTVNLGFTPSIVIWGNGHRCYIVQGRTNSFVAEATAYTQIDFLSGGSNNFRHNMTNVPCYYIAFK